VGDTVHMSLDNGDPLLSTQLADLRARRAPSFPKRQADAELARAYNQASEALSRRLNLDSRIWERAWPGDAVPSEQMITDALAGVLEIGPGEGMPSALQPTLLAGCPAEDREYYQDRPLQVVRMPSGPRLAPDLLLDGRSHHPNPPVSHVFLIENKYLANWQVPYAGHLYGMPAGGRYDLVTMWGIGHDDPSGLRVPHIYGTRPDCEEFWHRRAGRGLWMASVVQLDTYVAYSDEVLGDLGLADEHSAPLRVHGVLVDAWAREVTADLAVTWQHWTTVSYADLLADSYRALSTCDPGSATADRLKVLLARLLWL